MQLRKQWQRAFAVQASADLRTRHLLSRPENRAVPECHRLLFLQMACEKLVKASLFDMPDVPSGALRSHAVSAKYLPIAIAALVH